ncbi:uncharacterized protein LOC123448767 [Hordeum vulgare subsp. vulgare]|uniref:Predicted protein n=1 Tax=Hordeum vulgare subsp. vulgare TaxID=112509 RepID=F2D4E0_HORVV|nr:uncharacterized protein LOC123448767 [Hordeum vulgare subsp. vulgare]BAJ89961.1 predicted protein [Hordeum vulgare subsp. vulgare]
MNSTGAPHLSVRESCRPGSASLWVRLPRRTWREEAYSRILGCTSPSSNSKDCILRRARCRRPRNLGVQDSSLVR